jgi:hypothetical protein
LLSQLKGVIPAATINQPNSTFENTISNLLIVFRPVLRWPFLSPAFLDGQNNAFKASFKTNTLVSLMFTEQPLSAYKTHPKTHVTIHYLFSVLCACRQAKDASRTYTGHPSTSKQGTGA